MKQVWKFSLPESGDDAIKMPEGAKILTAQMQNGQACMWAEVDPEAPKVTRWFFVIGTGHDYGRRLEYISTFQSPPFVWHLFEDRP